MLSLLVPLLAVASAQAPAAEPAPPALRQVKVRVAVDDRSEQRLGAPTLEVRSQEGVAPVAFRDDGSLPGDVAGDRILVARVAVTQSESVTLVVSDEGVELATFSLPLASDASDQDLALKTRSGDPPLVVDTAAPAVPSAAEAGGTADRITVRLIVDDRALSRLQDPRLLTDQAGVAPVELRDDGRLDGDVADDQLWMAVVEVARSQYLSLEVEDRGQEVGKLSVFLPSSSEAEVRAQTVEGAEGLRLVTEPTGTGTTDDPSVGTSAAAASGGAGGQLAHVLWVGIALFAMAFAYVRNVVAHTWSAEVQPLLGRMEGYLDERSPSADPGAPPEDPS